MTACIARAMVKDNDKDYMEETSRLRSTNFSLLFIQECAHCKRMFSPSDLVMKVKTRTYHLECFRCALCQRLLQTGEEFTLRDDGIFCMEDHLQKSFNNSSRPPLSPAQPRSKDCATPENQPDIKLSRSELISQQSGRDSCESPPCPRERSPDPSKPLTNQLSESGLSVEAAGLTASSPEVADSKLMNSGVDSSLDLGNNNSISVKTPTLSEDRMPYSPNSMSDANSDSSSLCGDRSMSGSTTGRATGGSVSMAGDNMSGVGAAHSGKNSGVMKAGKRSKEQKTTRVRTVLNEKQLHTLRTCYGANPRPDALMKEQLVEMTGLSPRVIRVWFQNKRCKDKKRQILMKQMEHQQQNGGMQRPLQGIPMVATSPIRNDPTINSGAPIEVQQFPGSWKSEFGPLGPDIPDQPPAFQQLMNTFELGPDANYFSGRLLGSSNSKGGGGGGPLMPQEYMMQVSLADELRAASHPSFIPTGCSSPHYGGAHSPLMLSAAYART